MQIDAHRFLLPFVLAAPAVAQTFTSFVPDEPIAWPANVNGNAARTVSADFTGDGVLDVFLMIGNQPTLVIDPDSAGWTYAFTQPLSVNDFDRKPRAVGAVNADLAFVNAQGLQLLDVQAGCDAPVVTVIEAGLWVGARVVRVGDVNADGLLDYVGIGSDQKKLLVRLGVATGSPTTTSVTLPSSTGEIVLLDWNGGGALELALLTYAGVELRQFDGSVLWTSANTGPRGDAITRMRPNGAELDSLAWVRKKGSTGTQELLVFEYDGSTSTPLVRTTDLTDAWAGTSVFGIASADVRGNATEVGGGVEPTTDDDLDLVTFDQSNFGPRFFLNTSPASIPGGNYFSADASERIGLGGLMQPMPAGNQARPAFADLTGDGYPDLLVPVQSTALCLLRGQPPPFPVPMLYGTEVYQSLHKFQSEESNQTSAVRMFSVGVNLTNMVGEGTGYTHVNLITWHQDSATGTLTKESNYVYPLPTGIGWPLSFKPKFPLGAKLDFGSGERFQSISPALQDRYWIEARVVTATIHPQTLEASITAAGASWIGYVNFDPASYCATADDGWFFVSADLEQPDQAYNVTLEPQGTCPSRPIPFPIFKMKRKLPPPPSGQLPPSPGIPVLNTDIEP